MKKFNLKEYIENNHIKTSEKFDFIRKNIVLYPKKDIFGEILNICLPDNLIVRISLTDDLITIEDLLQNGVKIFAVEYGEIARSKDLQKFCITKIAEKIKYFAEKNNISFFYASPKIISERDFERVYGDIKNIFSVVKPDTLVVNNEVFLQRVFNDNFWADKNIEAGKYIKNEMLDKRFSGADFTEIKNLLEIKILAEKLNIKNIKYTIAEYEDICSADFCPLNTAGWGKSGLYCNAPCSKDNFAFKNPETGDIIPFISDGFCNIHFFKKDYDFQTQKTEELLKAGINRFVIDLGKK